MPKLNQWQQIAAKAYGGGDYTHLAEATTEQLEQELPNTGDTLFSFLMIELSDKEDCETQADAMQRVDTAIQDLVHVFNTLAVFPLKATV